MVWERYSSDERWYFRMNFPDFLILQNYLCGCSTQTEEKIGKWRKSYKKKRAREREKERENE